MKTLRSTSLLLATAATLGAAAYTLTHLHFDPAAFFDAAIGVIALGGLLSLFVWDVAPAGRAKKTVTSGAPVVGSAPICRPARLRPAPTFHQSHTAICTR